ncbi:serine hydrolase [Synergistales bacterium]|nr:serine hydrolase [Synergistales bacterium]
MIFFTAALSVPAVSYCAARGAAAPAARSAQGNDPWRDKAEFASFIDGFIDGEIRRGNIPGMAFAAVRGGETIYLKGYGFSDIAAGRAVSPDATLFRAGQISTVVTAMALLQLVERGRLSLDEEVNAHLRRWRLPGASSPPVTLRHLLTHTGGFDDKKLEICAPTSDDERDYAVRLRKIIGARYAPPGVYHNFSGLGYALVGAIVERYSRQNFAAAIERHIFTPLGMKSSTFAPNDSQKKLLATGYSGGNAVDYSYRYDMPATGMSATASDMGRLIAAALDGGLSRRGRVLQPLYLNSMFRRHFSPNPAIWGAGLAYEERFIGGTRVMWIKGFLPGYSAYLMILPDENFGLFYAANADRVDFGDSLSEAVAGRFFKKRVSPIETRTSSEPIPEDIAGYYRRNGISHNTAEKLMSMLDDQLKVSASGGYVSVTHIKGGYPASRWVRAETDKRLLGAFKGELFRRVDDNGEEAEEYMFFQRDEEDKVRALVMAGVSDTYDRLEPYEAYYDQLAVMAGFAAAAMFSLLGLLVGMRVNRGIMQWNSEIQSAVELWAIAVIFWGVQALFIAGIAISARLLGSELAAFIPYQVKALFLIPMAGGILSAWFWFRWFSNLPAPEYHPAEKLLLMGVALVCTAYMFFLADWRLLGFMF